MYVHVVITPSIPYGMTEIYLILILILNFEIEYFLDEENEDADTYQYF